jgi:citrate lyase subunit beta/citryl-CoA lyase
MSARSFLFVPGNRPERFDKACSAGADVVLLDLEDAVAPADKYAARESVRRWLTPENPIYLRLNGSDTDWFAEDLMLVDLPGVSGVALPKAETTEAIIEVRRRAGNKMPLLPIIETAAGLWNALAIASCVGVTRLAFGSVDYQLDTGILGEGEELLAARSQLVLVSRVAGLLPPVDGVTVAIDDAAALATDVARARRLGFGGKLCIHPKQVAAINDGFLPPASEVAWAKKIVDSAASALDNAVRVDGKLVDRPIIERARAILSAKNRARQ